MILHLILCLIVVTRYNRKVIITPCPAVAVKGGYNISHREIIRSIRRESQTLKPSENFFRADFDVSRRCLDDTKSQKAIP